MAQKVRIYPYSQYDRTVCLRAELIGCSWDGEFCFQPFLSCPLLFWLCTTKAHFQPATQKMASPCLVSIDMCTHEREGSLDVSAFCVGKKVFNLIVETYATQTFPEQYWACVCVCNGKIIKRIKGKQKTFSGVNLQIKLIWRSACLHAVLEGQFCENIGRKVGRDSLEFVKLRLSHRDGSSRDVAQGVIFHNS